MIDFIQNERMKIMESVKGLTDEELNQLVEEGTWTISQILMHLYLMEKEITKAIVKAIQEGEHLSATEKPVHLTAIRKKKFKAPVYSTPPNDYITYIELQAKLERSRKELLDVINRLTEEQLVNFSAPHPVFERLNIKQYVEFIGYHEDRHRQQIEDVKEWLQKK
jgi:uncharacterized damage-inducible protein DinB